MTLAPKVVFSAAVIEETILCGAGVAMDTTVVEAVVEVQELTLTELAQVGGGYGNAVLL